jgi:hypothetical protein
MAIRKREGNRPDRRIANAGSINDVTLNALAGRVTYVGSANHKLSPGDYGFVPPTNPRPSKSACDDIRSILLEEASALFYEGIKRGMVSNFTSSSVPKYVWAVDSKNQVYEAKTNARHETSYHGYRLGENEKTMREWILKEWHKRCQ